MFVDFLYELRKRKVKVGAHEAVSLARAIGAGLHESSLDGFYHVARALLVHREEQLDDFDVAFAAHFRGVHLESKKIAEELLSWLRDPIAMRPLTDEERAAIEALDLEEVLRRFEERLNEQNERHDGGNRWIGTGGTSPFGTGGENPFGISVGAQGGREKGGGGKGAIGNADARRYAPYRSDLVLDTRQIEVALRKLRAFVREGSELELDVEGSIDATAKNAGELEVVVRPPRRPNTRVVLLMDVGGSMDPYSHLVSQLFSAAKRATHWKELKTYYFHNCVYGRLYETEEMLRPVPVRDVIAECGPHHKLVMVGDAMMAPYELLGVYDYLGVDAARDDKKPGLEWLRLLREHFDRAAWLNPESPTTWRHPTVEGKGRCSRCSTSRSRASATRSASSCAPGSAEVVPREALTMAAARVRATWEQAAGTSHAVALIAAGVGLLVGAAQLARLGTDPARLATVIALALATIAAVCVPLARRRWLADPRRDLKGTAGRADPAQFAIIERATDLLARTRAEVKAGKVGVDSMSLAEVHLARSLWRIPLARVAEVAAGAGRRWSTAAVGVAAVTAAVVVWQPFRVVEGLDVLLARDGRAPVGLVYLDALDGRATPPAYLKLPELRVRAYGETAIARGTTIAVRGRPVHAGRKLVLTDGRSEVPFVDDGSGDVVARWPLADSAQLRVAARFGEVLVLQPDTLDVVSIPDAPPTVTVEGAPQRVRLLDVASIPLVYEAKDDHGLSEVALVLRAGGREERRTLSRPASDRAVERGGHELSARDPFFKKAHVPIEITIQARDDDAVTGPKWGKSASIVVVPPRIGEPESLRLAALRGVRDAFVDLLALRADAEGRPAAELGVFRPKEKEQLDAAKVRLEDAITDTQGGLAMRSRVKTIARGQVRRLEAVTRELSTKRTQAAEKAWVATLEELVLAVDASVEGLGAEDSRSIAKRLVDVADEAADASSIWMDPSQRADATTRVDAAVEVLAGGGEMLLTLGELGLDLGEIVQNDLRRVARAREALHYRHAELAARDLAARLRKPDPSFRGGGGHGHGGGVESGGTPQPSDGPASEADMRSQETERTLEEILRDQAQEIQDVQDALDRALTEEEKSELKERAKKLAEGVREAVKDLPREATMPDSAQSKAAEARQEAEAMAGALEQGRMSEATDRGQRAVDAMREASRRGAASPYAEDADAGRQAGTARPEVEQALQEVAEALRAMREKGSERAKSDLEGSSQDQGKLKQRVGELSKKGEEGERAMPGEMLDQLREAEDAMREAAKALEDGRGEDGLELQEKARRLLEMARGERDEEGGENPEPARRDGDGKGLAQETPVPKERREGPEEFRRRVLEGLGTDADPRLREAVRRYAEGLLR